MYEDFEHHKRKYNDFHFTAMVVEISETEMPRTSKISQKLEKVPVQLVKNMCEKMFCFKIDN